MPLTSSLYCTDLLSLLFSIHTFNLGVTNEEHANATDGPLFRKERKDEQHQRALLS